MKVVWTWLSKQTTESMQMFAIWFSLAFISSPVALEWLFENAGKITPSINVV